MSRYKLWVLVFVLFAGFAHAEDETSQTQHKRHFKGASYNTVAITYFSWSENATLTKAGATDHGAANLYGNALIFEHEHYYTPRWGYVYGGGYIFGLADVGGNSSIGYQQNDQPWSGIELSLREAYRLSWWIIVSAGAMTVYRRLNFPVDPSGASVSSGADLNFAGTVDLRMRLGKEFELREEIGSLLEKASTFWSLGLGYKFVF